MISFGTFLEDEQRSGAELLEQSAANAPPATAPVAGLDATTSAMSVAAPTSVVVPPGWSRFGFAVAAALVLVLVILAVRKW